jgi:hypothetical protein
MALQSQLFGGDPKLEAAAVSDPAHIVSGATGEHVRKIQLALIQLDGAAIAPDGIYGPATAAAVLTYKQKRNIVNRFYQTKADNIVGKMTMASLDQEMFAQEPKLHRCACDYGRPGYFGPRRAFERVGFHPAPAPGVQPPTPSVELDKARSTAPEAIRWARAAIQELADVENKSGADLTGSLGFMALQTHYRCSLAEAKSVAGQVKGFLNSIIGVLSRAQQVFVQGDPNQGAYAYNLTPRDGKIYIVPSFMMLGKLMRPTVLLHEGFHFLDMFNDDFGGNPAKDNGARYRKLDKTTQLKNAYALSQFSVHIHEKQERILLESD